MIKTLKKIMAVSLCLTVILALSAYPASAEEDLSTLTLGDFDYENIKIPYTIYADAGCECEGIIMVYKEGNTLDDSLLPVYADRIVTDDEGNYSSEMLFKKDLDYGTYTVEFYSDFIKKLSEEFTYFTPEEILQQKKDAIFESAKSAQSKDELKCILFGTDYDGNVVNDNGDIFTSCANMTNYNKVVNKQAVFVKILPLIGSSADFDEMIDMFDDAVKEQIKAESSSSSGSPSRDNTNPGSASVVMKDNKSSAGSSSSSSFSPSQNNTEQNENEQNNTPNTEGTSFEDMKGHWAEEFAVDLSLKGVINGYEDGTFRGDNPVTRAELAKMIVSNFDIAPSYESYFTDVEKGSWYELFVASAANAGVITGFEGKFNPDDYVTRQDASLMVFRALSKLKEMPVGYKFFTDELDIDDYTSDAVKSLGQVNILSGDESGKFNPKLSITRGEVAAIICRANDYIISH